MQDEPPHVIVIGACGGCERLFGFNPKLVPVVTVGGEHKPICQACVNRRNLQRFAENRPVIEVPPGAYASLDDAEIMWD